MGGIEVLGHGSRRPAVLLRDRAGRGRALPVRLSVQPIGPQALVMKKSAILP